MRLNAILSEVRSRGYGTRDPTHVVQAAPTAIQDRHALELNRKAV